MIEKYLSEQHAERRQQEARETFARWLAEKKHQQHLQREEEEEAQQPRVDGRSEIQIAQNTCRTSYMGYSLYTDTS